MAATSSKLPTHYLYAVTKRADADKANWTQIGAAWPNADGKAFSLKLNLVPRDGADIVMREFKAEAQAAAPAEALAEGGAQ